MKAIIVTQTGGTENLRYQDIPTPHINDGEVLVKVKAFSLNPVDIKTRKGQGVYGRIKEEQPLILGWDISGEVIEVGSNVRKFKVGDNVFGMVNFPGHGKAYAEFVACPSDHLSLKPKEISHQEAAASTLALLTAYQTLILQAKLKSGEKILIHAAAGGVGHFAVQIAKLVGAYIVGTSSESNTTFLEKIGVDVHVDYTKEKFEEIIKEVDVVLDPIGGDNLLKSLNVLKEGGRLVSIVGMSDGVKQMAQEKGIVAIPYLVQASGQDMEKMAKFLRIGAIKPHISKEFNFDSIVQAHQELEGGRTRGKIVVVV